MTVTYTLTESEYETAIKAHYSRLGFTRSLDYTIAMVFGIPLMLIAFSYDSNPLTNPLLILSILTPIIFIFRLPYLIRRYKKRNKPTPSFPTNITIKAEQNAFTYQDQHSIEQRNWSAFQLYKTFPDKGILLYPHGKSILWIPATATIENGTYQELLELIITNIQKTY